MVWYGVIWNDRIESVTVISYESLSLAVSIADITNSQEMKNSKTKCMDIKYIPQRGKED